MKQEPNQRWDRENLENPHQLEDKKQRVQAMFSNVASTYDKVNHVISLNRDHSWRRRAVQLANTQSGHEIVDVCCGTGDMALAFARCQPGLKQIVGVDFVEEMLVIARQKGADFLDPVGHNGLRFDWVCSDAEDIPLEDNRFDRASCVFGIRNLQHPLKGIQEMHRMLNSGGRAVILEFDVPENPLLNWGYQLYFRHVLPTLGTLISRDKTGAYHYLPQSVRSFNTREQLPNWLHEAGFVNIQTKKLNLGTVLLFLADKP